MLAMYLRKPFMLQNLGMPFIFNKIIYVLLNIFLAKMALSNKNIEGLKIVRTFFKNKLYFFI